jgi:hypothetical protein
MVLMVLVLGKRNATVLWCCQGRRCCDVQQLVLRRWLLLTLCAARAPAAGPPA